MNNSNPLIPQGSLLEQQQNKGRARVKFWVFCVIACHVLFFSGVLFLGCGKDTKEADNAPKAALPPPDITPAVEAPSNAVVPPPLPPPPTGGVAVVPPVAPAVVTPPPPTAPPEPPAPATKEYKVVKGDSFYSIGKKLGVSIKAIKEANPTVDPLKIKPGMTLQIPGAAASASAATGAAAPMPAEAGETYVVKSGDSLTKIAKAHNTSVKALRGLNGLKTDRLKVGDKLKLPAAAVAAAPAAPVAPPPIPAPAPAPATGAVPVPAGGVVR